MGGCATKESSVVLEGEVNFNHFKVLRAIGKGAFGKVCIVKKRDTKELYAMKYMNKGRIIKKNAVDNVLQEAEMMNKMNHPFIVNLWFSFQDEEDLFLVVDLLLGGDLSWHLEQENRMEVDRVLLYVAEVALALEYLKRKKIIHRDVKPANMLLDSNGHVHLTDFNVACYKEQSPVTACTGTRPYMAPEMFNPGRYGYSYSVDWWSLGVAAYEMMKGVRPFHLPSNINSFVEIYSILTSHEPPMSQRWNEEVRNLLMSLMNPHLSKRIRKLEMLRKHSVYQTWNFVEVQKGSVKPSFVPPKDQVNCDPTHELEEIILEPNPLHKKSHRISSKHAVTLSNANSSTTELEELARLQSMFKTYNRLEDSENVHNEKELHRKISSGDLDNIALKDSLDSAVPLLTVKEEDEEHALQSPGEIAPKDLSEVQDTSTSPKESAEDGEASKQEGDGTEIRSDDVSVKEPPTEISYVDCPAKDTENEEKEIIPTTDMVEGDTDEKKQDCVTTDHGNTQLKKESKDKETSGEMTKESVSQEQITSTDQSNQEMVSSEKEEVMTEETSDLAASEPVAAVSEEIEKEQNNIAEDGNTSDSSTKDLINEDS